MTHHSIFKKHLSFSGLLSLALVLLGLLTHTAAPAENAVGTINLQKIPEHLQRQYEKIFPELTERNRCVVAFDDSYDTEKMLLECSFNTRHPGESERRALKYCEQKRKAREISGPCRVVIDTSH